METATPHKATEQQGHGHTQVKPNDPAHDIQAKPVVAWILGWTVTLFLGLYFLFVFFEWILGKELDRKVRELPNTELIETKAKELDYLNGKRDGGATGKTIEQSMQELVSHK
jgi:hypothetical protein